MTPGIDPEGGLLLALVRGLSVAGLLSAFGVMVFRTVVMARVLPRMAGGTADAARAGLLRLVQGSLGVELVATLGWLVLQSADMAGAHSATQALSAVPVVLSETWFGHLVAVQLLSVAVVAAVVGRRDDGRRQRAACVLCALATALQAGHGHAAAMASDTMASDAMAAGPGLLLAAGVLHLLAAGAWLGGLAPLLLVAAVASPREGALAARWFTPLGKLCLVVIVATALVQGWVLVASLAGLVGTGYGWMVLAKTALFGVLFAFAVANRYRFAPALLGDDPASARRTLLRSIGVQTGFGVAVVAAAAVLSGLPPAMHVQPVWPFPWRLSVDAVREDPDLAREAVSAGAALACAALLALAPLLRWRAGRLGPVAAAAIAWVAAPHLDLLFVPAYPTSFQTSPTGFSAEAIVRGAALYPGRCASCHGAQGHGDGAAGRDGPVPPADLTAAHLWMHRDGELFWWLSHGIEAPEGGMAMPGFDPALDPAQRWDLIDYVRALNAGLVVRDAGLWSPPLQAPAFQLRCTDGRIRALADLRGGFVRLVIGTGPAVPDPSATTILATADPSVRPGPGLCIADDSALPGAYGIVTGLAPEELDGAQVLVDGQGWLRAVQPGRAGAGWNDTRRLADTIRQLQAAPIPGRAEDGHDRMRME